MPPKKKTAFRGLGKKVKKKPVKKVSFVANAPLRGTKRKIQIKKIKRKVITKKVVTPAKVTAFRGRPKERSAPFGRTASGKIRDKPLKSQLDDISRVKQKLRRKKPVAKVRETDGSKDIKSKIRNKIFKKTSDRVINTEITNNFGNLTGKSKRLTDKSTDGEIMDTFAKVPASKGMNVTAYKKVMKLLDEKIPRTEQQLINIIITPNGNKNMEKMNAISRALFKFYVIRTRKFTERWRKVATKAKGGSNIPASTEARSNIKKNKLLLQRERREELEELEELEKELKKRK